jgi:phosphate transport system substrate-binding protein
VAEIGTSSRDLRPGEKGLNEILIARDAIAAIVNPRNPLLQISSQELRDIFVGRIGNWQELGWESRAITVVTREEGSGTRGAFDKLILGEEDVTVSAIVQDSNGAVRAIVADDPFAIGYISLGLVNEEVKALRLDGVEATGESVERGEYRLVRPFLFLTLEEPRGEAKEFIDYVLSPQAQELLASEGLIRVGGGS